MKRHIYHYTAMLLFLLLTVPVYCQSGNTKEDVINLLQRSKKHYENSERFKLESNYKLYANYSSSKIIENYSGIFIKKGKEHYLKIDTAEFANLNKQYIQVDNESKLIDYSKNKEAEIPIFDFMKFMNNFSEFSVKTEGSNTVCTFTAPKITFVPYSKVVVYIDTKTKAITKQVLYLLLQNEYKDGKTIKKDYPRLEIAFSLPDTKNLEKYDLKFNLTGYIKTSKGKLSPSQNYAGYKIIDKKN
jgi:hypothetical protein